MTGKIKENREYLKIQATLGAAPSAVADFLETIAKGLEDLAEEKKAKELHLELYIVDAKVRKQDKEVKHGT